jgi:hypothetical protein
MSFTVPSQSKAFLSQTRHTRLLNLSELHRSGIPLLYISQAMRLAGESDMWQQSDGTRSIR